MQTRPAPRLPVRRRVAAASLVLLAPVATGCGFDVATDAVYQPAEGSNARTGGVDVLGAVVVSDTAGKGRLIATLVNKSNAGDQLTGVSGQGVTVSGPGSVAVPSNAVGFANLADSTDSPILVSGEKIDAGGYVTLRFRFADSDSTTLDVPVVDTSGSYAGLAPGQSEETGSAGSAAGNEVAARGSQGALGTGEGGDQ